MNNGTALADFARDVISRTGDGLLVGGIDVDDVVVLCGFLVAKYAVADISIPARLSPSSEVDEAWHRLLLYPVVYDVACRRAHELAGRIVGEVDDGGNYSPYAYAEEYPGVVDHSPNAANDPAPAKEQRRRAAVHEMNRLGLIPSSTAPASTPPPPRTGRYRANVCTPPDAPCNKRARLTNGDGLHCDDAAAAAAEEEAEEEEAEEEQQDEEEADEERADEGQAAAEEADEEDVEEGSAEEERSLEEERALEKERAEEKGATGNVSPSDEPLTIQVKDQCGEVTMFKVKSHQTAFGKIMHAYAKRKGVRADILRFMLDGETIHPWDTCADLELEDDDQVDVILIQAGC
ncbi:hypothetical protein ACHAXA_007862 [Cyclostephanos tholiformis]|uniref:Ubiquitin-like domain-containing protein n=1 Tax=Cyclostephanos tholiformis TaxID=382380 RepID=A0ABD3R9N6_9STRA